MRKLLHPVMGLFAAAQLCALTTAGHALGLQDKAALQAAMQRHVDRQLVDGVFPLLDTATGEVVGLHPVTAHPKIMKMGENFVLCFDFRNAAGKKVDVDFYMARKQDTFVVFHTIVSDHSLLSRLMEAGKVTLAN